MVKVPSTGNKKAFQLITADDGMAWASFEWNVGGTDKPGFALGPGGSSGRDVNLYRDSANVLRTGDTLVVDGNVGIGTTTPSAKLQVLGSDSLSTSFAANISGATGTGLVVTNEGNVGIGTTGPGHKLHVNGDIGLTGYNWNITTAGDQNWGFRVKNPAAGTYYTDVTGAFSVQSTGGFRVVDKYGATENIWLIVNQAGNVGIGTTTPSAKLQVLGSDSLSTSFAANISGATGTGLVVTNNGNIGIGTTGPSAKLQVLGSDSLSTSFAANISGATGTGLVVTNEGNIGIGTTGPLAGLDVQNGITASTGSAKGVNFEQTLTASANDDVLTALHIKPTFTDGVYTGVSHNGLIVEGGNVGIGDTTPSYKLTVDWNGDGTNVAYVNNSNAWTSGSADYAEYFYTKDTNLTSGESVCIDVERENAVQRCQRDGDSNIMGIVSTTPAFLGNAPAEERREDNKNYVIVGMLGQVPAKVTSENGNIHPGDSLTASSIPGVLRKANSGESTVGVALESTSSVDRFATIQVMISRKNKSLSVSEVEQQVTERIAQMEMEDQVNLLVSEALDSLEIKDLVAELGQRVLSLEENFLANDQTQIISNYSNQIESINEEIENLKTLPASLYERQLY
jgi:hypothetical protein